RLADLRKSSLDLQPAVADLETQLAESENPSGLEFWEQLAKLRAAIAERDEATETLIARLKALERDAAEWELILTDRDRIIAGKEKALETMAIELNALEGEMAKKDAALAARDRLVAES